MATAGGIGSWRRTMGVGSAIVLLALLMISCGGFGGGAPDDAGRAGRQTTPADAPERHDAAAATLDEVTEAMRETDLDLLVDLTTGPAQAFFAHVRHHRAALGGGGAHFENLRAEPGEGVKDGEHRVVFPGPIGFGTAEGAPPLVLTQLAVERIDDRWRLAGFDRNGHPIGEWVTPPPPDPIVEQGPITVEVTGVFVDVGCLTGSDTGCPPVLLGSLAVDLLVTNSSVGAIQPMPVMMPDGTPVPAWLETSSGAARPLIDAEVPAFTPGEPTPVSAVLSGADDLARGGSLHIAFVTADGTEQHFELPVPTYPHRWAAGG